ncbi:MAG: hypothetical protein AAGU05_09245, partial [Anaerolineaceae bacterium]
MKKSFFLWLAAGTLLLAGCANSTAKAEQTAVSAGLESQWDEATSLMTGTLLLQTTGAPLEQEQASSLLLRWNAYNSVMTSSTSAQAEIDGLIEQIKGVFTPEQMKAIEAMKLTEENYAEKLTEAGVNLGGPAIRESDSGQTSGMPQMPADGEMPFGGEMPSGVQMPSGGQMPSDGQNFQRNSGAGGQMPGGGAMPGGAMSFGSDIASVTGSSGSSVLAMQATQQAGMGFSERTINLRVWRAVIQYLGEMAQQP